MFVAYCPRTFVFCQERNDRATFAQQHLPSSAGQESMPACLYVFMSLYARIWQTFVHLYVCAYMYIKHIHMYTYVCTYTHAHTYVCIYIYGPTPTAVESREEDAQAHMALCGTKLRHIALSRRHTWPWNRHERGKIFVSWRVTLMDYKTQSRQCVKN